MSDSLISIRVAMGQAARGNKATGKIGELLPYLGFVWLFFKDDKLQAAVPLPHFYWAGLN